MNIRLQKYIGLACLLLCGFLLLNACAHKADSIKSAEAIDRSLLVSVPPPDWQALEPAVRQQLQQQFELLQTTQQRNEMGAADLAGVYGETGRYFHAYQLAEAAEACYLNAQKLQPQDYRWPHYLGHVYNKLNKTEQAIAHFKRALELRDDDFAAMIGLAENYQQQNQNEQAEALFQKALESDLTRSNAHAGLGQLALARRDFAVAVSHLEAALQQMPQANELYFPLAMAYRGLGNTAKAEASLSKRGVGKVRFGDSLMAELSELTSGSHVYLARGTTLMGARKYQEAHEQFRLAVTADPKNLTARVNYGMTFAYLNQFAEAKAEFGEVLKQQPNTAKAHFNLGRIYVWEEGGDAAAVKEFRATLAIDKNYADANLYMADALMRLGQYQEAATAYQSEIRLYPARLMAHARLIPALIKQGQYAAARAKADELLAAHPDNVEFQQVLARLLAAAPAPGVRNGQRALEIAQKSQRAQPSVLSLQTLAMAYAETGNYELARQTQNAALKDLPSGLPATPATTARSLQPATESELQAMLRADLLLYERQQPCRRPWLVNARLFFPPRPSG